MKNLLMALAFLTATSFALACPCKSVDAGCPDCGKIIKEHSADGKKIIKSGKSECEKCAKKEESKIKKN